MTNPEEPIGPAAPPEASPQPAEAAGPKAPPPRGRAPQPALQRAAAFLVSPTLAIALLVGVLACCLVGVTVVQGVRAWELIFSTLWFNGLLVLLALSSGAAFFTRIWRRKLTTVQVGMIVFHLSFMALLGGVVFNGLFHFKGAMRLTEGETLRNGAFESYDQIEAGRFFEFERLRGETTLVEMHTGYKVDGDDKRAAYEIEVGEGQAKSRAIIYITEYTDFDGIRYFCSKEGYSVLVVMADQQGQVQYGGHVPLQSLRQPDGSKLYTTGSASEAKGFAFPPPPEAPVGALQVTLYPSFLDRTGQVLLQLGPLEPAPPGAEERKGMVAIGEPVDMGSFTLTPAEIRYWVGMDLRYDPGLPVIMTSLVAGLVGMVLTFVGRVRQGGKKRPT